MAKSQKHHCLECGAELQIKARGRARKYCSDTCRSAFNKNRANNRWTPRTPAPTPEQCQDQNSRR